MKSYDEIEDAGFKTPDDFRNDAEWLQYCEDMYWAHGVDLEADEEDDIYIINN